VKNKQSDISGKVVKSRLFVSGELAITFFAGVRLELLLLRHVSRADVSRENVLKGDVGVIGRNVLPGYVLSAPKCVDRVNCWDGEEEVDDTEAKGGTKSTDLREVGLKKDFRGVISDNVDTAELNRISLSSQ
jgi:hypothetical protein